MASVADLPGENPIASAVVWPVLIVGAGPAGLASAACLKQRGIEALVLEAAPSLAHSWRHHYDRLHLHPGQAVAAEIARAASSTAG